MKAIQKNKTSIEIPKIAIIRPDPATPLNKISWPVNNEIKFQNASNNQKSYQVLHILVFIRCFGPEGKNAGAKSGHWVRYGRNDDNQTWSFFNNENLTYLEHNKEKPFGSIADKNWRETIYYFCF